MQLSIIMPVYNAEKYIEEAVASIHRQTWNGKSEIIIVDDGSDDQSLAIAKTLDARVVTKERGGAAQARNAGIELASADYIFFMDADDVLYEDALEHLFSAMQETPECTVVFGRAIDFISPELPEEESRRLKIRDTSYGGVLPGCALLKKSVFEQYGAFDATLTSGETVAWMMNVKESRAITREINQVTLRRRLHMTNTGRLNREQEMKNYAAILRKRMIKH